MALDPLTTSSFVVISEACRGFFATDRTASRSEDKGAMCAAASSGVISFSDDTEGESSSSKEMLLPIFRSASISPETVAPTRPDS